MGFKKATVLVSLLMVCFVLAAQSAKADTITFVDNTDVTTVTTDGNPNRLSAVVGASSCIGATEAECEVHLAAPPGANHIVAGAETTLLTTFLLAETANLASGAPRSDGLAALAPGTSMPASGSSVVGLTAIDFKFNSDLPGANGACPNLQQATRVVGCNAAETGNPQIVGTIEWDNHAIDTIQVWSDVDVVPEPASLILFGSGLALAGGFIRRRRRAVMPSVVA